MLEINHSFWLWLPIVNNGIRKLHISKLSTRVFANCTPEIHIKKITMFRQTSLVLLVISWRLIITCSFFFQPLLGTTCLVSGIAMCVLGAWFFAQSHGASGDSSWLPVAALCLCIYCDAAGLQPVPFVIMTEMFTFQVRPSTDFDMVASALTHGQN